MLDVCSVDSSSPLSCALRVALTIEDGPNTITGIGDSPSKRTAEKVAYMSTVLQLGRSGLVRKTLIYAGPNANAVLHQA